MNIRNLTSNKTLKEIFEDLPQAVELYKTKIKNKTFEFILDDGSEIKFKITPNTLPHILGVNTLYHFNDDNLNSYQKLLKLINQKENYLKLIISPHSNVYESTIFNSLYQEKIKRFLTIETLDAKHIKFIIKYKKVNDFNNKLPNNAEIYIYYSNNSSMEVGTNDFLIGFTKSDQQDYYSPVTLISIFNEKELWDKIENQEAHLVTASLTNNIFTGIRNMEELKQISTFLTQYNHQEVNYSDEELEKITYSLINHNIHKIPKPDDYHDCNSTILVSQEGYNFLKQQRMSITRLEANSIVSATKINHLKTQLEELDSTILSLEQKQVTMEDEQSDLLLELYQAKSMINQLLQEKEIYQNNQELLLAELYETSQLLKSDVKKEKHSFRALMKKLFK